MKMKEKLVLSVILLGFGTVLNLFFTAALHGLLSGEYHTLTPPPLPVCLEGLLTERRQLHLFLSFEGFLALSCVLFWVQNSRPYQSELVGVAGDIRTPAPVGQYQHGSARWLEKGEREGVFETQIIDPNNEVIRMLLDTGYDDLPFMEKDTSIKNRAGDTGRGKAGGTPGDGTAAPSVSPSVPINIPGAKGDEYFEPAEYVFFPAGDGGGSGGEVVEPLSRGRRRKPVAGLLSPGQKNGGGEWPPGQEREEGELSPGQETGKGIKEDVPDAPDGAPEGMAAGRPGEGEADPYKLFPRGGIVVGMEKVGKKEKLYMVGDDTHTLTIGATRSGKTRCLVVQSICAIALAGESLVVSDPKAELYHYTAGYLKKLGYEVICLDFKNPGKSARYNLLQPVIDAINGDDLERAEMYAWDITNILVGDNTSNEKIWENGEKSTIAAAILCVVADNRRRPEYQNLTNVYWFIAEMGRPVGGRTPMGEYMKRLPARHPARALMSIAEVAPSRTRGSFDTSALTTLRLFTSRSVHAITHRSDYDIADAGRRKQALFLILPDEKTTYYPIASLMVSQLYELLVRQSDLRGGRLERRVNFVLDEFGNFTKLGDFTNKLTVAGGRGVRFNLFLQSLEQLAQKYDRETAAIVKSNCQTWVYLQADDREILQEVCDKLGKYTASAYQLSSQHGRYVSPSSSHSVSLVARELLTTDEVRRVSRPYQIVIGRGHPAMMEAPDLSGWYFNRMCGLGDPEHNRRVREAREGARPALPVGTGEVPLWNIWVYYTKDLQLREAQQKSQVFGPQGGAVFPSMKGYKRTGGSDENEEED